MMTLMMGYLQSSMANIMTSTIALPRPFRIRWKRNYSHLDISHAAHCVLFLANFRTTTSQVPYCLRTSRQDTRGK